MLEIHHQEGFPESEVLGVAVMVGVRQSGASYFLELVELPYAVTGSLWDPMLNHAHAHNLFTPQGKITRSTSGQQFSGEEFAPH